MKKTTSMMVAVCLAAGCSQPYDTAMIDRICSEAFHDGEPGAAVLVMKGDRTVFEKCYGLADMETGAPITPETSFNIASVSKQFTATAVLQLCSEGRIGIDDKVSGYLPEYTNPIWKDITIGHILSHCSGIPDARKGYTREQKLHADDKMAIEYLDSLDFLHFQPGTEYEYMNPTYVLAAKLVERVSGEEFTSYVHNHIFSPAGMDRTVYFDPDGQDGIFNMAHGYERDDSGSWQECDYGEETFFATRPDGGIYCSIREFVKWENALRKGSVLPDGYLLDAQSPHTRVSGSAFSSYQNRPNTWYGYGWFVEPADGTHQKVVYHTGDNGGFKIMAARYPESGTLILIFANRNDWSRYELLQRLEDAVL